MMKSKVSKKMVMPSTPKVNSRNMMASKMRGSSSPGKMRAGYMSRVGSGYGHC
jgi:hypothetical protein